MRERFLAFVAEQSPFAIELAAAAFDQVVKGAPAREKEIDALRSPLAEALRSAGLRESSLFLNTTARVQDVETTPGVSVRDRLGRAVDALVDACDGFLRREAIAASLKKDERLEILRGMLLTRALDTRLKQFFSGSEVQDDRHAVPGEGVPIARPGSHLRRGHPLAARSGVAPRRRIVAGDVIGPIIRDVGAALGMRPEAATIRMVLNAQMGKTGPPMDGRDLHIGDVGWGIVPASAPLSISSLTVAGMGLAFSLTRAERVGVSFIGEGGSSLGEWHEAINMCAARRLPVIFCLQNNQTALSTPVPEQSAVRVFADKAVGYGIPGITIDGTDPDAIAAAFAWAAERARAGRGPALIELVAMRMCGHAHHDDMLYLGKIPSRPGITRRSRRKATRIPAL